LRLNFSDENTSGWIRSRGNVVEWVQVEIVNWTKYNPRSDRGKHSWFRLENDIAIEPKFEGLSASQKFVMICVFAEVSKNKGRPTWIRLSMLRRLTDVKFPQILSALRVLEKNGVVRLPSGDQPVTNCPTTERNETERNETNNTAVPEAANFSPPSATPDALHPESIFETGTQELLSKIKPDLSQAWVSTYEAEWVKQELKKATVWLKANPARAPKKDFGRFMTSWLSRGWESHRKTIQTRPVRDYSFLEAKG
jgi:hypothetical protein